MKVFNILTHFNYAQTSCVVAEDMATAERLFKKEYPYTEILKIELHSNYVIVQEDKL